VAEPESLICGSDSGTMSETRVLSDRRSPHGFNVFFLRNGEGAEFFPEANIQHVLDNHWTKWSR
jgi:hypothetical protein